MQLHLHKSIDAMKTKAISKRSVAAGTLILILAIVSLLKSQNNLVNHDRSLSITGATSVFVKSILSDGHPHDATSSGFSRLLEEESEKHLSQAPADVSSPIENNPSTPIGMNITFTLSDLNKNRTSAYNETVTTVIPEQHVSGLLENNLYCEPWEVDTDDWWTHHPDWEVSYENKTHYCFSPIKNERKAQIFRDLYRIGWSNDTNCSIVVTKRMVSNGWGASVSHLVDGLLYSLSSEQPLQIWVPRMWGIYGALRDGSKPACPTMDVYCYYLKYTKCPPDPNKLAAFRVSGQKHGFFWGEPNRWLLEYSTRPQTWLRRESYLLVTNKLMVYQPGSDGSNMIPSKKASSPHKGTLPKGSTCMVMHVRRADAVLDKMYTRKYHPISDYFKALQKATSHNLSYNNLTKDEKPFILLLTDDSNAVGEALVEFGRYPWMYLDRPRFHGTEGGWENHIPSGEPRKEVIAIEAIRRLLKQCKPPFIFSQSNFADYLLGIFEEQHPSYNKSTNPPLYIKLDDILGSTMYNRNYATTANVSKKYMIFGESDLLHRHDPIGGRKDGQSLSTKSKPYCQPWDTDSDDWWTHHPDWEASLENETHYCFSQIENERKAKTFRDLYEIGWSSNANCSSVITKRMISSGWGATISNVVDGMLYSLSTKQPFQTWVPRLWIYGALPDGTKAACPRMDMFCYYLNFTHCPPNPDRQAGLRISGCRTGFFVGEPNRWLVEYITRPQTWLRRETYKFISRRLMVNRPDGNLERRSSRPANSTKLLSLAAINSKIQNERFPDNKPCIVMHVRRADAILDPRKRQYFAISDYLQALWNVSKYHHPAYSNLTDDDKPFILLLTDDGNAIGEAIVEHGQYPWIFLDRPRHRGAEGGWQNHIPSGDPKTEVIAIESVRWLVKRCKPPFVFSHSGFADYLLGIMEEHHPSLHRRTNPPLFVKLNEFFPGLKLWSNENAATLNISKNYIYKL